jgi:hypothetical protein
MFGVAFKEEECDYFESGRRGMDEPWIGSVSGLKGRKRILGEI